jgi:peptide/nickel transport system permease protein
MASRNSHMQLTLAAFKRRKTAVICFWILVGLYAAAFLAPLLAPYHYADEMREFSYCPPTPVHWLHDGKLAAPFVYGRRLTFDENHRRIYVIDRQQRYPVQFFQGGRLLTVHAPGRCFC